MYRRSLQQQRMETDQQYQFLQRFSSLPVMETAASQLASIYTSTKSKSSVLKYTLEVTEYGVGKVVTTTKPIVDRLEKPIGSLDNFACSQLTKLESSYPIIGKPTEEVFEETKNLYNSTVGPTVQRVGSVKDYSVNTVTSVKDYGVNKVTSVKDYGVNTVSAVKDYSVNAVTGVKNYTVNTLGSVTRYGVDKLNYALDTTYGKAVIDCVDGLLDNTEKYVDYYLPENEEKEGKKDLEKDETNTLKKTMNLSKKVRMRMYNKAMRDFHNIQKRSKETVDNMTFTVDLIQYAKKHLDGVTGGVTDRMSSAKEKLAHIWEEINKTEDQVASDETSDSSKPSQVNDAFSSEEIDRLTMERRLIATARHLTLRLKHGMNTATGTITTISGRVLPTALQERLSQTMKYTDDLYNNFAKANNLQELPTNLLEQVRDKLGYITESMSFATEYITTLSVVDWLAQSLSLKKTESGKKELETAENKEKVTPAPANAAEEKKDDKPEKLKSDENEKKKTEQSEQPKAEKNKAKKNKKPKDKEPGAAAPAPTPSEPPAPITNGTNGTAEAPKPAPTQKPAAAQNPPPANQAAPPSEGQ